MKKTINFATVVAIAFSLIVCAFASPVNAEEKTSSNQNEQLEALFTPEGFVSQVDASGETYYIDPKGASDEYYYLESYSTYGSEFVIQTERYSDYLQAGIGVVSLATATAVIWAPVPAGTILKATFDIVKGFVPSVSKWYNTTVTHYGRYGQARFRVEVAGQFRRYATYSDLKVPTRKVYNYL